MVVGFGQEIESFTIQHLAAFAILGRWQAASSTFLFEEPRDCSLAWFRARA